MDEWKHLSPLKALYKKADIKQAIDSRRFELTKCISGIQVCGKRRRVHRGNWHMTADLSARPARVDNAVRGGIQG